jgi:hypothetical protein
MSTAITNVASEKSTAAATALTPSPKAAQSKSQSAPAKAVEDTVQLSQVAQTAAATIKEARETPAQTAKEAVRGDLQAKRLLAKETATTKSNL